MSFKDCTHNLKFDLGPRLWKQDLEKSGRAALVGYQEVSNPDARSTVLDYCVANNRGLYHPTRSANPISWDKSVFTAFPSSRPVFGMHESHLSANEMGIPSDVNPARDFTWAGLKHIKSGKTVLRINVHPVADATDPSPNAPPRLAQWQNWAMEQYWLDVMSFTAAHMSLQMQGTKATARFWDVLLLGGDYNGALKKASTDEWYYPSQLLASLYAPDRMATGLDHLQHVHGADCKVVRRWTATGNTDHKIHFVSRDFAQVDDTPG